MRTLVLLAAAAACACGPASQAGGTPEYGYEVVRSFPHDPAAFTQGLFYLDGFLYEGTGLEGQSSVRKVRLETGEVLQKRDLPEAYFGEGIVNWKDRLIELTWTTQTGFVYDLAAFTPRSQFRYTGEGWGLTQDGRRIVMSDGSAQLRFWNPETMAETGRITVTDAGNPVTRLNELEWVNGEIYANVWQTNRIARIDPAGGKVTGWINMAGLATADGFFAEGGQTDVLNGIAWDEQGKRLFITGKKWPRIYQIRLVKKSGAQ